MVNVNKVLIILLLNLILTSQSEAKCLKISNYDYYQSLPIFLKGSVSEIVESKTGTTTKDITLSVNVLSVLKGDLKSDKIDLKYKWANMKEPLKTFEKGKVYIFRLDKKNKDLIPRVSTCDPDLTEAEIGEFKSMK